MIEDGVVKGVMLGRDKVMPNEFLEGEVLEADCVISTLPVWNVLRVVPESALPDWYVSQIRYVAQDHLRISWIGLYMATREETFALDPQGDLDLAARAEVAPQRLRVQPVRDGPDDRARRREPDGRGRHHPGREGQGPRLPAAHVRALRGRHEDDVPGPEERLLAAPAPRPRPVLRRHPDARPGRHVPPALARAQRRGAVLRFARRSARAASASTARRGRA